LTFFDRALVALIPVVPRPFVRKMSEPYIAGTNLAEAVDRIRVLNSHGLMATLDILGEHIEDAALAQPTRIGYLEALDEIDRTGIDSNISVKLSQLALHLDPDACYQHIREVVARAGELNMTVRLDMEDSGLTDVTLDVYRRLREDFDNVGIVLQAMLRRTLRDVRGLADLKPSVRVCKGIYVEPWKVAYQNGAVINRNFCEALEAVIDVGGYPAIATHDERLVYEATRIVERRGLSRDQYEFQMLLGVREELREVILAQGHRLRVYVPFGEQWYAYSIRRMRENPRVAGMVARAFFGIDGDRPA